MASLAAPINASLIFLGLFVIACGVAELLPSNRTQTATVLRFSSGIWLLLAVVMIVRGW